MIGARRAPACVVSHHMAKRQFLRALYVFNAYEGHLDAMVFGEAKQNRKFSYLEAFCFNLPCLVSKNRAKVTNQKIVVEARAVNAMKPHGWGQPRGSGKGKGGADTSTSNPTPGDGGNGGAQATRILSAGSDTRIGDPRAKADGQGQGKASQLERRPLETKRQEGQSPRFRTALSVARYVSHQISVGKSTRSCVKQPCGLVRPARAVAPEVARGSRAAAGGLVWTPKRRTVRPRCYVACKSAVLLQLSRDDYAPSRLGWDLKF